MHWRCRPPELAIVGLPVGALAAERISSLKEFPLEGELNLNEAYQKLEVPPDFDVNIRFGELWSELVDEAVAVRKHRDTAISVSARIAAVLTPLNSEATRKTYLAVRGVLRQRLEELYLRVNEEASASASKEYRKMVMAHVDDKLSYGKKKARKGMLEGRQR
jgi:hypothetical protein